MKLVLRCDVSPEIGHGHLMRCRALAQEWVKEGHEAIVASCELTSRLRDELATTYRLSVKRLPGAIGSSSDLNATAELAEDSILVLDGYDFGPGFMTALREGVSLLGCIDDDARHDQYPVDVLINYNHHAIRLDYEARTDSTTRLCLGLDYALIRPEFLEAGGETEPADDLTRILVSFGGSDPRNSTLMAARAIGKIDHNNLGVDLIVGPSYRRTGELSDQLESHRFEIHRSVPSLAPFMAKADLALCAGGLTVWELASTGTPMISIIHAKNQQAIARSIDELGMGKYLGWYNEVDPDDITRALEDLLSNPLKRERFASKAHTLVDGRGPERLRENLMKAAS